MKAYPRVFDGEQISRKALTSIRDRHPDVANRHAFFGNTACTASVAEARTLARRLKDRAPDLRHRVTGVDPEHEGGRVPRSVLDFPNAPAPA